MYETMNYLITFAEKTEPVMEVTQSQPPNQKFGFLYFNDEDGLLIIAVRVDSIKFFEPTKRLPKQAPTVNRGYTQGQR